MTPPGSSTTTRDRLLPGEHFEPGRELARQAAEVDHRRFDVQRRCLGGGEVIEAADELTEGRRLDPGRLDAGPVERDHAVGHRLELRDEHGRGRGQVVGEVAGRSPSKRLGPFEAIRHGVEGLRQLGRFAVVAARGPGGRVAGFEASSGVRDVPERPRDPSGHRGRDQDDPDERHEAGHQERDVEEGQEAADRGRTG